MSASIHHFTRFDVYQLWRLAFGFAQLLRKETHLRGEEQRFQEWFATVDRLLEEPGLSPSDRERLASALNLVRGGTRSASNLRSAIPLAALGLRNLLTTRLEDGAYTFRSAGLRNSRYYAFLSAAIRAEERIETLGTSIEIAVVARAAKMDVEEGRLCTAHLVDRELAYYTLEGNEEEFLFVDVEDARQALRDWEDAQAQGENMLIDQIRVPVLGTLSPDYAEVVRGLAKKHGIDDWEACATHEEVIVDLRSLNDDVPLFNQSVEAIRRALPEALTRRRFERVGGDTYNVSGTVGAIGPGAVASGNTFQVLNAKPDIRQLADDLERLYAALKGVATSDEEEAAIGAVAQAKLEAKRGNGSKALEHLKAGGKWVFKKVEELGLEVAKAYLLNSAGLG